MKRMIGYFRVCFMLTAAALYISLSADFCFASREDVILGKDYQLESERETLKDKFSWEINCVYGLSSISRLSGLGAKRFEQRPSKEYLDTLDMVYSYNDFLFTLGANYLMSSRLEFSAGLPVSVISAEVKNDSRNRTGGSGLKIGAGDLYAGISYALLTESNYKPLAIVSVDINSDLSKYTSMGDGFWGVTPGLYLRKFVFSGMYVSGLAGHTYRLKRRGVEPGNIIRYGAGLGFLSGNKKLELNLEKTHTDRTKIAGKAVMAAEDDLSAAIAYTAIFASRTTTIGLSLGGLEKGFNWGQNYAGLFIGFTF